MCYSYILVRRGRIVRKWCIRGGRDTYMGAVVPTRYGYLGGSTLWDIAFFVGCVGIGYTIAVLEE